MTFKIKIIFFSVSLLFALAAGIYASFYSQKYYSFIEYGPDPLDGLMRNERAYFNVEKDGRCSAFIQEFKENNRSFLCIAPLIIFAPEVLRRHDAHLFITIPYIFLFLYLLCYLIWMRSKNIFHAICVAFLYITCYAISEPYFGIGFNMPDMIAGYPLAIAALSLLIWNERRKTLWIVLFSAFLSIAVLTRFIFSVYAFLLFSGPLTYFFLLQYRSSKITWKEIAKTCLLCMVIIAVLCGYYILSHFNTNMEYYSYWLNSKKGTMNISILQSGERFLFMYAGFLRKIHASFLILLFIINIYFFEIDLKIFRQRIFIFLWMFLVIPFYWVVILKTNGHVVGSAFIAAFPLMFMCLAIPINNIILEKRKKIFSYLLVVIIVASIIDFSFTVNKNDKLLTTEIIKPVQRKLLAVHLSEWFNTITPRDCTLSLIIFSSGYIAEDISLESFYKHGKYIRTLKSGNKFSVFNNYYNYEDPKTDIEVIKNDLFEKAVSTSNLLIFNSDISNTDSTIFNAPISRQVERALFERFSLERSWKKTPIPDSSFKNLILFYRDYLEFSNN